MRAFLGDPSLGRAWLILHGKATAGYVIVIFWFDLEFGGRAALITEDLTSVEAALAKISVQGERYPEQLQQHVGR